MRELVARLEERLGYDLDEAAVRDVLRGAAATGLQVTAALVERLTGGRRAVEGSGNIIMSW